MKNIMLWAWACTLALETLCSSCASYKVYRLSDDKDKANKVEGIRFNRPAPYFLVGIVPDTSAKKKAPELTIKLIYLPDRTETYAIRKRGVLGTTEAQVNLQDGWNLVEYGSKSDSKIPETVTATASLAGVFFPKAADSKKMVADGFPSPGLWRITFDVKGQIDGVDLVPGTAGK